MQALDGPGLLQLQQQLKQQLQQQALAPNAVRPPLLLDVREPWELAIAQIHLEGLETARIPMNDVPERHGELDPTRPVVCICHHGVRSAHVGRFLERQGFAVVYNLTGGIEAWSEQVDANVARY